MYKIHTRNFHLQNRYTFELVIHISSVDDQNPEGLE
jgi:hypothetical protein